MQQTTDIAPKRRGWECPSCKHRWIADGAKPRECEMCGRRAGETHNKFMRRLLSKVDGVKNFKAALADNIERNKREDEGPSAA